MHATHLKSSSVRNRTIGARSLIVLATVGVMAIGVVQPAFARQDRSAETAPNPDPKQGMPAGEHASHGGGNPETMNQQAPATSTDMDGMSASDHAEMNAESANRGEKTTGIESGDHGNEAAMQDRPAVLVIGGFALLNGAFLLYAAIIRRRPDAVKRRRTLARVRATEPVRTVMATPSSAEES